MTTLAIEELKTESPYVVFLVQEEVLDAEDLPDDLRLLVDLVSECLELLSLVVFFLFRLLLLLIQPQACLELFVTNNINRI